MKIKAITDRYRRDFAAIYECEHCGDEHKGIGYDDDYFHANVIPKMQCEKCGKKSDLTYQPKKTRYPAHAVI